MRLKVVSPYWILMCRDEGAWASEDIFPHTYNPKVGSQRVSIAGTKGGLPLLVTHVSGRGSLGPRGHLPHTYSPKVGSSTCP